MVLGMGNVPVAVNSESEFQIGEWSVRPLQGTLSGPGGTLHLEPKVMGVLVHLAARAGDVVTREQFIEHVWHGRVVSDEVLSRCISLLRTHLGDSAREPRFIQTLPKIGYRLITPVAPRGRAAPPLRPGGAAPDAANPAASGQAAASTPVSETSRPTTERSRSRRIARIALVVAIVLAAFAVAWGVARWRETARTPQATAEAAIVVLPFVNLSGDPGDEYFSDGLTEELIDRLARVPGLRVVARTSAFAFKERNEDVRAIAARLGVGYVLEGSVRKEGDQVRITAQLVDAGQGFHLWSQRFDVELQRIFAVQDEIANAIVVQLQPRLAGSPAAPIATEPPTPVIAAYELLLRSRFHLKRRDEAPIRRSIALLEQALELDPRFVEAYCELARAYALLPYYSYEDQGEMFDLALATIERGAAADPRVRDAAQDTLAFVHYGRHQWIEAEEGFRRALASQPSDPNLHQWYSQQRASVGDARGSLEHAELARKFDVLSPVVNDRLAVAYLWVDDDARAHRQFGLAEELGMGPTANPEAYLISLLRQRDYAHAREILLGLQKLFARANDWVDPFLRALQDPAARPDAVAAVGRAVEMRGISLKYQFGAWVYLGEADRAIDVAFELLHEPTELDVEFLFARETAQLRAHARFGELVTALGLDRYWGRFGWPAACARRESRIECH